MAKAEGTHGERQISSTTGDRGCPVPKTQGVTCPGPLKLPETGPPYRGRVSMEIFPPARGTAPGSIPLKKKKKGMVPGEARGTNSRHREGHLPRDPNGGVAASSPREQQHWDRSTACALVMFKTTPSISHLSALSPLGQNTSELRPQLSL